MGIRPPKDVYKHRVGRIRGMAARGLSAMEIAPRVNMQVATLRVLGAKHGIEFAPCPERRELKERRERIVERHIAGDKLTDIARDEGIHKNAVIYAIRGASRPKRKRKNTAKDDAAILAALDALAVLRGSSPRSLAVRVARVVFPRRCRANADHDSDIAVDGMLDRLAAKQKRSRSSIATRINELIYVEKLR